MKMVLLFFYFAFFQSANSAPLNVVDSSELAFERLLVVTSGLSFNPRSFVEKRSADTPSYVYPLFIYNIIIPIDGFKSISHSICNSSLKYFSKIFIIHCSFLL